MDRANIKRPVRLNDGRTNYDGNLSGRRVIGRVIAKTLDRDEGMDANAKGGGKVRFIIDGTYGYVSIVETGMDTRAGEAAKVGSIIEVSPPSLRKVDRNIQALRVRIITASLVTDLSEITLSPRAAQRIGWTVAVAEVRPTCGRTGCGSPH